MKELRAVILRMRSYGDSMGEIAKNLRIPKATMQKAIQRGTVEDRPGRGRRRTARTPENTRKIKAKIQRNLSSRKPSRRRGMRCLMIWLNEWLIADLDASKRVSMQKEYILNKFFVITLFFIELNKVYRIVYVILCHPVNNYC